MYKPADRSINQILIHPQLAGSALMVMEVNIKEQTIDMVVLDKDDDMSDTTTPVEQVRLTIPMTDDPTLPVLTFRTWLLGPITCVFISIFDQFASYRQVPVSIPTDMFRLAFIPIGKLLAAKLPTKSIRVPFTNWTFSMNPGPFNAKEHYVLSLFALNGIGASYVSDLITISKTFFHKGVNFWGCILLLQSSQMMGYGVTGIFMKFLVKNPYMWWPFALSDVTYYQTLNEVETRPKGKLTRLQFFVIVSVSSFAYYIIPSYFFPSMTALSFVCWIWKDSVTAQQIGSGLNGLGIGSFSLDWISITNYGGDPLVPPMFSILNTMVGVILVSYILAPIGYWTNAYNARRFPLISSSSFDASGQIYNESRILNDDITLNEQAYQNYSPMYLSIFMLCSTGFTLASETATLAHFVLYHARGAWNQIMNGIRGVSQFNDVHNKLMNKYEIIPQWWFYTIILSTIVLALLNSILFGNQFQLPFWVVMFEFILPFILILPIGIIRATTGMTTIRMSYLSQLIIGFIYPGNPIGNLAFESYTTGTLGNSLSFMYQFKVAHYMKIPPKSLFIAQVVSSFINNYTSLITQWWLLTAIDNICDTEKLPEGSPWTCPYQHRQFTTNMIWGAIGPTRMFSPHHGQYSSMYIFFVIGVIPTVLVWIIERIFPEKKWIKLIHVPLILASATDIVPPCTPMYLWCSFTIAVIFNGFVYRRYKEWWAKYNYLLSSGLAMGPALMVPIATLGLNMQNVYGVKWWGLQLDDHCPLAKCPTAPGVKVDGCPVF